MSKPLSEDLFSFTGRRNRKSYILLNLLWAAAMVALWGVGLGLSVAMNTGALMVVPAVLSLPWLISNLATSSQRCRDFGWSGWALLIAIIPYIGGLFGLAIFFIPGTVGSNRYGPDLLPPPVP
jgi:uncharacterized membrane protein YhaH (DUF805 family)